MRAWSTRREAGRGPWQRRLGCRAGEAGSQGGLFLCFSHFSSPTSLRIRWAGILLTTRKTGKAVAPFANSASGASLFRGTWGRAPGRAAGTFSRWGHAHLAEPLRGGPPPDRRCGAPLFPRRHGRCGPTARARRASTPGTAVHRRQPLPPAARPSARTCVRSLPRSPDSWMRRPRRRQQPTRY